MHNRFWALWLLLMLGTSVACADEPQSLQLLGRSSAEGYQVPLDEQDWQWLRGKRVLRLGVSGPDYPPFEIARNHDELEGITADYAALVAELLHVKVEVLRYRTRDAVMAALKQGEIDLLGTSNNFEAADPGLSRSSAYAEDQPMLVTRLDEQMPADLAGKRIAMVDDYLPAQTVQSYYPEASLQRYASTLEALGAVAFGQDDVYLGDLISANYLINNNYLNNVHLVGPSGLDANPFGFALASGNPRLKRMVDKALAAIPMDQRLAIEQRWSAGRATMAGQQRVSLSASEQRWLDRHPKVIVGAVENFAPLSFYDAQGKFSGLTAQLLNLISQRSGLSFEVQRGSSLEQQKQRLKTGAIDVLPAIIPSAEDEEHLRFTRAYLSNPFVLVSANTPGSPRTLEDLAGKRLAIYHSHPMRDFIQTRAPQVQMVEVDSLGEGLEWVMKGQADAALSSLFMTHYLIARHYRDRLRITSTVGDEPARITLATDRGALELHSILNKALLSISPQEMDELVARWSNDVVVEDSYWLRHRQGILQGFAAAAVLLLLALSWIAWQRRQIRQRQQWLGQLQEAKDAADDANRAKTTFLATMSHEIRTPMNALLGMLELALKRADEGVTDRSAIEVASNAGQQLLALIGDILDIARIESGQLTLAPERANLRVLVESVGRIFEGLARQKHLQWRIEFDELSDRDVLIDPTRFKQVLSNLLSNAIKFTREGEVSLTLRVTPGLSGHLLVSVHIADSGIGISELDRQRLFSPFVQADNNPQSGRHGSGLGLVISRTLCEMMGGRLHLDSVLGRGTQIEISLDLLALQPLPLIAHEDGERQRPTRPLTILVVDDYPGNRLLLSRQLSYLGHRVLEAEDGESGLARWREQVCDLVITDCNMPRVSGYELAGAIRDAERFHGATPTLILGFTANAQPEEKIRCLEAGMDDCLFKPIRLADLSEWLASKFAGETARAVEKPSTSEIDLSGLEQYVGEDRTLINELLHDLAVTNREDRQQLIAAHVIADRQSLQDLAHRIKGGARMVRALKLIGCCEQLEKACSEGCPALIDEAVDHLQHAMARLDQSLAQG
ncbi:transporter substrate-binding domain-containing protein [Pseudomonas sp. PB120]|uniref:transporter substrate-binding domain-containing protein n=1 Tax=Pseudomonas sp. PB120 TaxID=2494700 RepID=UPI0012FD9A33|nr:transporter substrate-binding domain-containing protein [Pseudomonas sp. PB120]MVV47433.1 transporter substrate-binding domain-containing protein [Pseudomonas sp. PB120]